jgi:hypothetical protein
MEVYLLKNRSSTAPRRKTPIPSKAVSSQVSVTSVPRAKAAGPGKGKRLVTGCDATERTPSICRRITASPESP